MPSQEVIGQTEAAPPPVKPAPPRAEERLGDILRRVREHRGEPLDSIADYLRIRSGYLVAIENSQYDALPADAYVIGFLRSYANYLGLDGKAAIDQYRKEMAGRRKKPMLTMPQPVTEGRAPTVAILIVATILALLIYAAWYGLSSSDRAVVNAATTQPPPAQTSAAAAVPPTADAAPVATPVPSLPAPPLVASTATPPVAVAPPPAPAAPPKPTGKIFGAAQANPLLSLRAEKESWVMVVDKNGVTIFDHIMKPGDSYNVPDIKGLRLTTGNGGGVVLTLGGTDLPRLAPDSRIVRNLPLEPDLLKARLQAP